MRRISFLMLMLTGTLICRGQNTSSNPADLQLKETVFDFGKIPQGKPVYHIFEFHNAGTEILKLDDVHASCGCTTPEWDRSPVPAGGKAQIKVGYNSASEGPFEKTITLTYNGSQNKVITIKGQVWKAPEGSAPPNAGVKFLKKQNF